jgi:hypothetical protein
MDQIQAQIQVATGKAQVSQKALPDGRAELAI